MKANWSRVIAWLESHGHPPEGASAKALVRARNAWAKQQNFGSDVGGVTIGQFRELARNTILVRLRTGNPGCWRT